MQDTLTRSFALQAGAIDEENRRIRFTFSSEYPFDRGDYIEVLSHAPGAVNLDRLARGGGAFVNGHDLDAYLGDVIEARIESGKGHGVAQFSESPEAEIVWQDVRKGLRQNVSVGYLIAESVMEPGRGANAKPTRKVTRWEPYEISSVPVPIDPTVGIGRRGLTNQERNIITMKPDENISQRQLEHETREAVHRDRKRAADIRANAKKFGLVEDGERAITDGVSSDEFLRCAAAAMDSGFTICTDVEQPQTMTRSMGGAGGTFHIRDHDVERYSLTRALAAAADGKLDGLAAELSAEIAHRTGKPAAGFYVPHGVLAQGRRDMTVGTNPEGGYLSETWNLPMIDRLTNKSLVIALGAQTLTGLHGSPSFPRMGTGNTAYWVGESATTTESTVALQQVNLSRKTISADTEFTKELLVESSTDVESMLRMELLRTIGLGIDQAALNGEGANSEPLGILNTSGIGTVEAADPDGGAVVWSDCVKLKREVRVDNADTSSLAFMTNATLAAELEFTEKATNTGIFIFEDSDDEWGKIGGRRCGVSNAVPSDGTKGSGTDLSTLICAAWSELVIGFWGQGLDVVVDPYSKRTQRIVGITASNFCDIAVRHPEAFAVLDDAVTT